MASTASGLRRSIIESFWPARGPKAMRPARPRGRLQGPEYAGLVRIAVVVGHVGLAVLLDEHRLAGEQLASIG